MSALGQVAGALASAAAVFVALYQTYRATREQRLRLDEAARIREREAEERWRYLVQSLLAEIRENRRLLTTPFAGYAKGRLYREVWLSVRPELHRFSQSVALFLQDSYQYAALLNNVVDTALTTNPVLGLVDDTYNKVVHLASERFQLCDRDLTEYLISLGVEVLPYQEKVEKPLW